MKTRVMLRLLFSLLVLMMVPTLAEAYVGPGSGLTVVGAALAFFGSIVLVIIGFVWYPVKRLWRWLSGRRSPGTPANPVA